MTGLDYFAKCLYKYADFDGRASRSEYWFFILFQLLFIVCLSIIGAIISRSIFGFMAVGGLLYLATVLPRLAVASRRLHDMGQSAWFLLLALVPAGSLALLVMFCLDSQPYTNKWGPVPDTVYGQYDDDHDEWLDDHEILDEIHSERMRKRNDREEDYV